jgi:hypothetical protein
MKRTILFILLILIGILVLTNPNRRDYLEEIADDFGSIHAGMELKASQLEMMGSVSHSSFLIFSTFQYQFGSIGVRYWGFGTMIFYLGSQQGDTKTKTPDPLT